MLIILALCFVVPEIIISSIEAPKPGFSNIGANNLLKKNFAINAFFSKSFMFLNFLLINKRIILHIHFTEYGKRYKSLNKFSINLLIKLIILENSI